MKRLVIIDGNAVLHRAYHALPPLTDPAGNIVNAVYGFTSMLLKIFSDMKPQYVAVAFDRAAPTFRKELYKEYQATRPKMDDDLIPQIEKVHDVVRAMGVPIFEMDGYEADDIIGTIVDNIKNKQVIIVTGDRDILQLVDEGKVFVYMPTKGLSEARLYGEKETIERMGVKPNQIPDFKALAGDQSDHYPGVEGIGPKTAVDLLSKFGSLEGIYQAIEIEGISQKIKDKLIKNKENALLSHNLATIRRDVPVEIVLSPVTTLDTLPLRAELNRLGFHSLIKRLDTKSGETKPVKEKKREDESSQQSLF